MGKCKFCGANAGFLKSEHPECSAANLRAAAQIPLMVIECFQNSSSKVSLQDRLAELHSAYITPEQIEAGIKDGLASCIDMALEDHILTDAEILATHNVIKQSGLATDIFREQLFKLKKAHTLREVQAGRPQNAYQKTDMGLLLKKDEGVLWAFEAILHVLRTKTQYAGRTQGASVRVMKGVYYRIGGNKGEAIRTDYLDQEGNGTLTITNKNVYFVSDRRSLTLSLNQIMSVDLYADAIRISVNKPNSRPMFFSVNDPSYAAMLICNSQNALS